ncbi:hypothetical protein GCM10009663_26960 [Kitasatospora arboriphila]|uniref:Serine/threonine protein kinase n=2 Tax=Streptomycetaceae TaxID=2062 RepID=A0ABP4E0V6_9ACTN
MQYPSQDPPPHWTPPHQTPPSGSPTFGSPTAGHPAPHRSNAKTWGVVAAVVSAAAGVASAIAAFTGGGSGSSAAPGPAPQVTGTVAGKGASAGTGDAATAVSPAPAGAGRGAAVRWSGKILFGMEGIDLSALPPRKGTGAVNFPSAQRSGSSGMKIKGQVAPWEGPGEPTAEGCRDLLQTRARQEVDVAEGDRVCVVNESSPIGLVTVTGTHYDQGSYGELDADLKVWNLRLAH